MENFDDLKPFDRVKDCLQDYSNDFVALLQMVRSPNGIESVHKLFSDEKFRVKKVDEYLSMNPEILTEEERKNDVFIKKSAELNSLADKINTNIDSMTKEELEEVIESAIKIFRY